VLAFDAASDDSLEGTVTAGNRQPVSLSESQRRVVVALCRPFRERVAFATPASNKEIANELFISVDTVKTHLRAIFAKFGLDDLPQNEKRARLAETVMHSGLMSPHDL
jgi:FixJ family two-component response regulator